MEAFKLQEGDKFGLLAIQNVYSAVPANYEGQLSDGTWVLTRVPVEIAAHWKEWIGSLRFEKLKESNIVLLRAERSTNPEILDEQHEQLGGHLAGVLYLLQLSGVLEYHGAALLKGSLVGGRPQIREMGDLPEFRPTKGNTRSALTIDRLEQAIRSRAVLAGMQSSASEFRRVIRGLNVLLDGLQKEHGQERNHQCVRSLEALILPEIGETKKQFARRCQTFAKASATTRAVLEEAFDMRSDTEHLHEWDRSLLSCPADEREDVALQRTRQMERLASFAYSRILGNEAVRGHFRNEATQGNFWTRHDDAARKAIWGDQLDLAEISLIRKYDQWGRAMAGA